MQSKRGTVSMYDAETWSQGHSMYYLSACTSSVLAVSHEDELGAFPFYALFGPISAKSCVKSKMSAQSRQIKGWI